MCRFYIYRKQNTYIVYTERIIYIVKALKIKFLN